MTPWWMGQPHTPVDLWPLTRSGEFEALCRGAKTFTIGQQECFERLASSILYGTPERFQPRAYRQHRCHAPITTELFDFPPAPPADTDKPPF